MTRFTNSPMEGIMKQIPRARRGRKHYGLGCVLPCYRGVKSQPV